MAVEALDRVRPRVEERPARSDAAGPMDRALLPRRGDRVRRWTPPVRVLPSRRLPPVRRRVDRRARAHRETRAGELDAHLHRERVDPRTRRQATRPASFGALPDGAMVRHAGNPALVLGPHVSRGRSPATVRRSPFRGAPRSSSSHRRRSSPRSRPDTARSSIPPPARRRSHDDSNAVDGSTDLLLRQCGYRGGAGDPARR